MRLDRMQNNALDASWLSALGLGWVASIDWLAVVGLLIGFVAIVQRHYQNREAKRANDIKERELKEKGL